MVSGIAARQSTAATIGHGSGAGDGAGRRSVAAIFRFAGPLASRNQPGQHGIADAPKWLGEFSRAVVPLLQDRARTFLSAGPVVDLFILPERGRPGRRFVLGLARARATRLGVGVLDRAVPDSCPRRSGLSLFLAAAPLS